MNPARGLGIRYKLFLLFLALIVAPFLVYTSITMVQSARNAEHAGRYAARQALVQAERFIASRLEVTKRSLGFVTLDPQVRSLCATDPEAYRSLARWNVDATTLRRLVLAIGQSNPDLAGFTLYMAQGPAAHTANREFQRLGDHLDDEWYRRATAQGGNLHWFGGRLFPAHEVPCFHGVARIPDDLDLGKTVGYVRVDVPARLLEGILDQAQYSAGAAVFLLDALGEPVALSARARGPDRALLPAAQDAARGLPAGPPQDPPQDGPQDAARTLLLGGRRYLADAVPVSQTDWRLVLLLPYEDIDAVGKGVRRQMGFALAVILPLMLPLSFWVASTSTRRIARLTAGVREFERGNLTVKVRDEGGDEIGELTCDLNRMAERISSLLEERYRLGQEMKNSEMRALQAQINPHFLYNTLELVNCLALRHGAPPIAEAVEALSRFYRLSLSGGAETVTLAQELEHVQLYVRVQNMRFDDGVRLELDVPEALRGLPILKIVLQPLVENAILHGIREKDSRTGAVAIRARRRPAAGAPDVLEIAVEDDGVGMPPARLLELRQGVRPAEGHGYGVRNIDRRLKVKYGEWYGLEYDSAPGRGTRVTLRLPVPPA